MSHVWILMPPSDNYCSRGVCVWIRGGKRGKGRGRGMMNFWIFSLKSLLFIEPKFIYCPIVFPLRRLLRSAPWSAVACLLLFIGCLVPGYPGSGPGSAERPVYPGSGPGNAERGCDDSDLLCLLFSHGKKAFQFQLRSLKPDPGSKARSGS
jgi:hypothetical protein